MEARAYHVFGRVQGVGFRWWTHRVAEELGLVGDVRNLRDGSVEVRAAGAIEALDALERALREGPPSSRVERVTVEPLTARPTAWTEFSITRD